MNVILMLRWRYSEGFRWVAQSYAQRMKRVERDFSVRIIIKTLFAPWKQMTSSVTSHNFFQALVDNTVSRLIGFIVRLFVLIAAGIVIIFVTTIYSAIFVIWPIMPLLVVVLPLLGIWIGVKG
jgi:hypothetical protein